MTNQKTEAGPNAGRAAAGSSDEPDGAQNGLLERYKIAVLIPCYNEEIAVAQVADA